MPDKLTDKELIKAMAATIERLQADCENYKQVAEHQQSVTMDRGFEIKRLKEEIENLQAENERLKNILICFMGALGKVRNIDDIESISQIPIMTELNKGIRAEIKAEAYKECIGKAKSEIDSQAHSRSLEASGERFRIHKILDNLLKELVGE